MADKDDGLDFSVFLDFGEQPVMRSTGFEVVSLHDLLFVQAERAGLGRRPSETSSELALRMLDVADVDRAAVTRLLGLYREARFSPHEVGEDDRRAALDALARIRAGSGAVR